MAATAAACASGSQDHPVDGLHTWSDHDERCEQEGGPLPCGLAAFEADEREERLVEEFRAGLRADRMRRESDLGDGEGTPACLGCTNGCRFCEPEVG
jgi:hypothetical protein